MTGYRDRAAMSVVPTVDADGQERAPSEIKLQRFWWLIFAIGLFFPFLLGVKVALNIPYHNAFVQGYLFYVSVFFAAAQCVAIAVYSIGAGLKYRRLLDNALGLSLIITFIMFMELTVAFALKLVRGHIHFPYSTAYLLETGFFLFPQRWEPHLGVVLRPKANFSGRLGNAQVVSHTSKGTRTVVGAPAVANNRIALIGGSTTYDNAVNDEETWASRLQMKFGSQVELINFGVPGYTTVENIWQTAFYIPDQNVSCAVYLVGGNDVRLENHDEVDSDFEKFHLRHQIATNNMETDFGLPSKGKLALEVMVKDLWYSAFPPALQPAIRGAVTARFDTRVERLYRRNLRTIVAINRMHGIKTVFIPAFSNRAQESSPRWIPFVAPHAVPILLARLRDITVEVARAENVDVLTEPENLDWQDSDFVDWSHFSARGSRKFADAIADDIRRLCVN